MIFLIAIAVLVLIGFVFGAKVAAVASFVLVVTIGFASPALGASLMIIGLITLMCLPNKTLDHIGID